MLQYYWVCIIEHKMINFGAPVWRVICIFNTHSCCTAKLCCVRRSNKGGSFLWNFLPKFLSFVLSSYALGQCDLKLTPYRSVMWIYLIKVMSFWFRSVLLLRGARSGVDCWGTALLAGSHVQFPMGSLKFFIDLIFSDALWAYNRNE